jgi:hypothetical protein
MVGHEGQRKGTWKGDGVGEGSSKKIDHGDGEGSEDQRDNAKIPFWVLKWIKEMGEDEKEGGVEESWVLFVKSELILEAIPRIIKRIDLVPPKGFLIKCIKSQCKTYQKTNNDDNDFLTL